MLVFKSDILPDVLVSQYISNLDSNGVVSNTENIGNKPAAGP